MLSGAACGDDEPTGPIPDVAGTYTGSFIVQFLLNQQGIQGSMQVVVAQAGESVTITGEIQAAGGAAEIPSVTGTLDATGFLELTGGGFSASVNEEFLRSHQNAQFDREILRQKRGGFRACRHRLLRARNPLGLAGPSITRENTP